MAIKHELAQDIEAEVAKDLSGKDVVATVVLHQTRGSRNTEQLTITGVKEVSRLVGLKADFCSAQKGRFLRLRVRLESGAEVVLLQGHPNSLWLQHQPQESVEAFKALTARARTGIKIKAGLLAFHPSNGRE